MIDDVMSIQTTETKVYATLATSAVTEETLKMVTKRLEKNFGWMRERE